MNSNVTSTSAALVAAIDAMSDFFSTSSNSSYLPAVNGTTNNGTTSMSTSYYSDNAGSAINAFWTYPAANWYIYLADNWKYQNSVSDKDYPGYPVCDHTLTEQGEHVLEFAVPRFTKDELKIKIDDDKLIISGTKSEDRKGNEKKKICLHKKIGDRDFKLSYKVPEKLDVTKTTSSFENGILTITIPLKEEIQKRNKEITIK